VLIPGLAAPAVSDAFYLAFYPLVNNAVVLLVRDHGLRTVPAVWLDGLVVGLGSAAVVAALLLAPLLRLEPPLSAQAITNLAYPVADLTLLIVLTTVGGVTRLRLDPRLALLGLGLALNLVTDLAYLLLDLAGRYHEGDPVDLAGCWRSCPSRRRPASPARPATPPPTNRSRRPSARRSPHPRWPASPLSPSSRSGTALPLPALAAGCRRRRRRVPPPALDKGHDRHLTRPT
jgi:hypothetical protein